jgi:molybdenum cofactor sulfurtransferase
VLYGGDWGHDESHTLGPTVALNVLRDDGSFVGYNEVAKLAALSQPPLQFRTGCVCNPGACQQALGLTDEQVLHNFETVGHVCGDHIDLVNAQPTGAIRISFGKDSLWEDLDAFVMFIEKTFVNKSSSSGKTMSSTIPSGPTNVQISELYIFPIKSCAAQRVSRWPIDLPIGKLTHDREFALVDTTGTAMRLQTCPKMGLLTPSIDLERQTMTISAPGCVDLILNLSGDEQYHCGDSVVKVCGNKCGGRLWGDYEVSEWFSSFLGVQCWLARFSNGEYQTPLTTDALTQLVRDPGVGFANEQPLLLVSECAVAALNRVLANQNQRLVGSRHFRPNIVVAEPNGEQEESHIEDSWESLTLKDSLKFQAKGSCARCAMIDFDPTTQQKGKTLRALASYRRRNGQITFGIFLQAVATDDRDSEGHHDVWIEEGDTLICR